MFNRLGVSRLKPHLDGLLQVAPDLVRRLALGDTSRKRGNLRPVSPLIRFVNDGLDRNVRNLAQELLSGNPAFFIVVCPTTSMTVFSGGDAKRHLLKRTSRCACSAISP